MKKSRGRPFQPGNKFGRGRPKGSGNFTKPGSDLLDRSKDLIDECVRRALEEGDRSAMRLCMERMLAPKRERPVAIDLPAIETPADARKALAVVTAELAEGNLTITEASKLIGLIGLIQRMLRLVGQIEKMEKAGRQADEAKPLDRAAGETKASAVRLQVVQNGAAVDPALYFPVNPENAAAAGGAGAGPSDVAAAPA
jgi:hypothetical protein